MEFGRMPRPATWHALPHVGTAGRKRPDPTACTNPQVGGVLRSSASAHRQIGDRLRAEIQRRILSTLPGALAQASLAWQAPDLRARQRQVPPRPRTAAVAAPAPQGAHPTILAAIQSRAQPDRQSLEADPPIGHTQSTLPDSGRCHQRRARTLRILGQPESAVDQTMRD